MPDVDFEGRLAWFGPHLDRLVAEGARILTVDGAAGPVGFVTVDARERRLDQLAVHPMHQGAGLGALLIAGAKHLSPAALDLEVNRDNAAARRLYLRHGFVPVGQGRNPRSGLPTIAMRWTGTAPATGRPR